MLPDFNKAIEEAQKSPYGISVGNLAGMLACDDEGFERELFSAAREVKVRYGKSDTLPRGLIECSNVCAKDCAYCGIRRGNRGVRRYRMGIDEVGECVEEARRRGYPAVAFQAGEVESEENTAYYERILSLCGGLEVTLSLGEQDESVYRRWKAAGALRYLIRIETTNRSLYARLHPSCSFDRRLGCIRTLKRLGYITGSGVMTGLPGQTCEDLARDIVFFGDERLDMVGMGPYIGTLAPPRLKLALRMIALTRLYMHDINIVAATALSALDSAAGRNRGLDAGANVIMPDLTPGRYRSAYDLYPGKATAG